MDTSGDLTKLKVADLKKELKIRGLAQTGKRNELLERLQTALGAGVGLEGGAEDDGDEEYDEDEILAGDDADDDDSKMTPLEEAAALAAAEKAAAAATPRGRRIAAAVATPRTGQKKLSLRRTMSPTLAGQEPVAVSIVKPAAKPAATPAKPTAAAAAAAATTAAAKSAVKKPLTSVKQPAVAVAATPTKKAVVKEVGEPAKKVIKLAADTDNKENSSAVTEKTPMQARAERFGVQSDELLKQQRADRFGPVTDAKPSKLSMEVGTVDVGKLRSRANRFGETTAKTLTEADMDKKKKARMDRFGETNGDKKDVTSAEALEARAAKFGTDAPAPDEAELVTASGKKLITINASPNDIKKMKRAARFGA